MERSGFLNTRSIFFYVKPRHAESAKRKGKHSSPTAVGGCLFRQPATTLPLRYFPEFRYKELLKQILFLPVFLASYKAESARCIKSLMDSLR